MGVPLNEWKNHGNQWKTSPAIQDFRVMDDDLPMNHGAIPQYTIRLLAAVLPSGHVTVFHRKSQSEKMV